MTTVKKYAIGTDIGGSHLCCALVDLEGQVIVEKSFKNSKVNNQASSVEILDTWASTLLSCFEFTDISEISGIGFAMPGPFNYPDGIALFTPEVAKYENLYNVNIAKELSVRLGLRSESFRFMNDASAFAVGEAWLGAASGATKSVSITLGTGFGSAFVENGIPVVEGENVPIMGCVWHLPFKKGIGDDYFSTRWYTSRWNEMTGEKLDGVKSIAEKAVSDTKAKSLFDEFGENLGNFLGLWLKKFEADLLIIGGNIAGAYELFEPSLKKSLHNQKIRMKVVLSTLKENAAIIGSARMLEPEYWEKIKPTLQKM